MSNINPQYTDRVRYTLYHKMQGSLIVTEPIGWKSDEKELSRNEQYHGIFARYSNSLKFIGSGKDFIQLVYDIDDINGEIFLKREERHPQTDVWTLTYNGYLDLSTYELENNQISIKFNSGGIEQLLKSRESEQVEIDRLTTIDGKNIPELETKTVALKGRNIFLNSKLETNLNSNYVNLYSESNVGDERFQSSGIPLEVVIKSHDQVQSSLVGNTCDTVTGTTGMMFFAVSSQKRTLQIKTNITFRFNSLAEHINYADFYIFLTKFKNGISYDSPERVELLHFSNLSEIRSSNGLNYTIDYEGIVELEAGESLCIEPWQHVDFEVSTNAKLAIDLTEIKGYLTIKEDSFFEKSNTKTILAHELLNRLVTIDTNKENAFYSDFLGRTDLGYPQDGPGAYTGVSHGFWVRQFDKLPIPTEIPKVDNLFKPLTTSFKDALQSIDSVWNLGVGIEIIGNKERVRVEDKSYFFNRNVTIRLPNQVKKVKRFPAIEYYYSSLEFGCEKGGDYEEACGLDEYNTKSTFTTIINRVKETYSKISKYRTDSYGMEFARRKPKSLNDTEDTKYDTDVFMMDLKKGLFDILEQRTWNDDFNKIPTGVFSPDTATNLRFSPFNCMLRHSWWFSGSLIKYASDFVRYGSSVANSQLKTQLIGKNEYAENGNIVNSELQKSRFVPKWIEFEHECTFDVMQQVEGTTTILGKEIKNFYGLVEFINEDNEKEKGFLLNLKPNGEGNWKVLKFNK